jgi:PAS domain S-box-containing protein
MEKSGTSRTLTAQLTTSFIMLVLLAMLLAWLPEVWLISDRFERETWARVEQGRRAAVALHSRWATEVNNTALLTAQLPTLQDQVVARDVPGLDDYLRTVETSLDLDLMVVCDDSNQILIQHGAEFANEICTQEEGTDYRVTMGGDQPAVWLTGKQPVRRGTQELGSIVAGLRLDNQFAEMMRSETDLEHTLLLDGRPVATSIESGLSYWEELSPTGQYEQVRNVPGFYRTFRLNDQPYYATRLTLEEPNLEGELAMVASGIRSTQRTLLLTQVGSVLLATILASILGVVLARRMGEPLQRLAQSAAAFSHGDMDTQIPAETGVQEMTRVAEALEQARQDLKQSLNTLEQEKAWVVHLLQAIVEGIATLDEQGRITFFSGGAERITGWQREEVLGRHSDEVLPTVDGNETFSQLIPPAEQRRRIAVSLRDGRTATLDVSRAEFAPPEADNAHLALVFRDVSEEEAYQRLINHFLANVTHEFRTPLTALGASVELLMDQAQYATPEELQRMLSWLHLGILNLQTLVDNVLESASLEAGRFNVTPEPTDLGEIIAEATRLMHPLLYKYNQRLTLQLPSDIPVVNADAKRVVQVFINLLSNANKYAPEGSEIALEAARQDGWVRVAVSDEGRGVPPEHRDDLFHRFATFGSESDKGKYGVGLGLWVVKAIVRAHGGDVGVEDRPEGGATFWFTLPVTEAS